MYQRIVVPMDGSPEAERVLPYVEPLAVQFKATIVFVHVVPRLSAAAVAASPAWDPGYLSDKEAELATATLQSFVGRLQNKQYAGEHVLLEGDAGEEIVRFARETGADLIAMVTHGRGGIERLIRGSEADEVMRHAPCPTLLVRLGEPSTELDQRELTASFGEQ
jgi:nucleotide-binding universal stress UspA family protein